MQTWLGLDVTLLLGFVLLLAVSAYAVLGGADYGGGIWDLLAFGPRADEQRRAIHLAMEPVWEANHVWLIFILVVLWTIFPPAFFALSTAFFWIYHLVLLGIILRGAAFVFRAHKEVGAREWTVWARVFGIASLIAPFFLGIGVGALSTGGIRRAAETAAAVAGGAGQASVGTGVAVVGTGVAVDATRAFLSPFSLVVGLMALAISAYLAAIFMTVETEGALRDDFRSRAYVSGGILAALATLAIPLMQSGAPGLAASLSRPVAAAGILLAVAAAVVTVRALRRRKYTLARAAAVAEVALIVFVWLWAQMPYIIYPDFTVANSIAPAGTVRFLLNALPFGLAVLIPSLWFLFTTFKGRKV